MSSDPHTRKSYAEAMNQWATSPDGQRSFAYRSRISLWQPDPLSPFFVRLLGYAWRLAVLALVGALVYFVLLRSHLGGRAFVRQWENGLGQYLRASEVKVSNLKWQGQTANTTLLTAQGAPGSLFSNLEASNLRFTVPLDMLWDKEWIIKRVSMGALAINLRSGGLAAEGGVGEQDPEGLDLQNMPSLTIDADLSLDGAADGLSNEGEGEKGKLDLRLMKDGFGVSPNFNRLQLLGLDVSRLEVGWGRGAATKGSLNGDGFSATQEKDGAWHLEIQSGVLGQNWLNHLEFTGLKARLSDRMLVFDSTTLTLGQGKALLSGHVTLGEVPELDLTLLLEEFPVSRLLDKPFSDHVELVVSGTIKIGGSTNRASGVTTKGELTVHGGVIGKLAMQRALVSISNRVRLREFDLTGGSIVFETGAGRLDVSSFDLQSRDDIVLSGNLSVQGGVVEGRARVGIDGELLARVHRQVQDRLLPAADNRRWLSVPLSGEIGKLTQETETALLEAAAAAPKTE